MPQLSAIMNVASALKDAGIPVIACCSKESEIALILKEYSCGIVCAPTDPAALNKQLLFYKNKMRMNISRIINLPIDKISVKATTSEGLGIIGKDMAMACKTIVLLKKNESV
mgnify:CR=1 FL=1